MPIHTVNIDEAKDHFFDLIATTAQGNEVIITDNGKALARLIPATDAAAYQAHSPTATEFSTDDDPLAWDADGWETVK
jgi:prevent-host-death family protein